MRTAGVDLASQPKYTALCIIEWDEPAVEELLVGVDDEAIVTVAAHVDRVGIDAPFGWPEGFVTAVAAWHSGRGWPVSETHFDALHSLRFRATDREVHAETGRWPLSVSTDLISVVAFRCARILSLIAENGDPVDRSGVTGKVVEAYPAAALHRWGLASRGYKGARGGEQRDALADGLALRLPALFAEPATLDAVRSSDHALDALVAAVIARAAAVGLTDGPPPDLRPLAQVEGWIHLPRSEALAHLAST